jgi:aldehyde:ferredoxin oxidoreductase
MMKSFNTRIAHIDLSSGRIELETPDPKVIRKWGAGSGLASLRLYRETRAGTDPLGPDNPVWITGGPLTGTVAPCSGRTEIVTRSALTGILGLSNTGGHFGARLKHAGYDGLVLHGASDEPVYVVMSQGGIEIRKASHLWGKDTWKTAEEIGKELQDPELKRIKVAAIGPAGENLVRFACLVNEYYHTAARGGVGAVLGAKKVKAVVVDAGGGPLPVTASFREACRRAARKIRNNSACQNYSRFGSLSVSDLCTEMGDLPGRNFQTGTLDRWKETRGTERLRSFVTRPEGGCYRCAMPCFNAVEVKEGEYEGLRISSGTFVQVVLEFGAKCAIESLPVIWKCKEVCHRLGMDYGSASGAVSFGMELFQRGLLDIRHTDGLDLSWGNGQAALELLARMAYRRGLGDILAEGTLRASQVLDPASISCVMTVKGMEMIGQDVRAARRGWSFGTLTSPRGGDNVRTTHMQGDTIRPLSLLKPKNHAQWEAYSSDFVSRLDIFPEVKEAVYGRPPLVDPLTYRGKAALTKWFEDLFSGVNALGLCTFPADKFALGPTDYGEMLSAFLGEEVSPREFMEIGERIFNIQRLYMIREGRGRADDTWPERFFQEPLSEGPAAGSIVSREAIANTLSEYYEARGWDRKTGRPTSETLKRLGIDEVKAK